MCFFNPFIFHNSGIFCHKMQFNFKYFLLQILITNLGKWKEHRRLEMASSSSSCLPSMPRQSLWRGWLAEVWEEQNQELFDVSGGDEESSLNIVEEDSEQEERKLWPWYWSSIILECGSSIERSASVELFVMCGGEWALDGQNWVLVKCSLYVELMANIVVRSGMGTSSSIRSEENVK